MSDSHISESLETRNYFHLSREEKALRKAQEKCTHPSYKCSVCGLYKDNLRDRDRTIQECINLLAKNNAPEEFILILANTKRLNKYACCEIL